MNLSGGNEIASQSEKSLSQAAKLSPECFVVYSMHILICITDQKQIGS